MQDIAISVKNVSKAYRIWRDPSARLKAPLVEVWQKLRAKSYELLAKSLKLGTPRNPLQAPSSQLKASDPAHSSSPYYKDFYALKDVSFEVKKGEAVGIIGRNGSGKSTLLQMIAGTLTPTSGSIKVNGRVAALLELGSGFNPEFTGKENIYLNASVLGLKRDQIEERLDSILGFADIGDFVDQPVKTYSSGMIMRLAFAVQTAVEPEILIIDEALGVGDFFFIQKCFKRIRELASKGTTLIFVSHDMSMVRDLCPRVILLNYSEQIYEGDCKRAINIFYKIDQIKKDPAIPSARPPNYHEAIKSIGWLLESESDKEATITRITLTNSQNEPSNKFLIGDLIKIRIFIKARNAGDYTTSIAIKNKNEQLITSSGCQTLGISPCHLAPKEETIIELNLDARMEAGLYNLKIYLGTPSAKPNRGGDLIDETQWSPPFEITWDYENVNAPFLGMFGPPISANYQKSLPPQLTHH
jgi:lipopolysaccharide transport system ATP-binding protein